jgi:hypothetical protein
MPPVFMALQETPVGLVIDALVLILSASKTDDWTGKLTYFPL